MSTALPAPRTTATPAVPWLWWGSLLGTTALVLALFGASFLRLRDLWELDQNYSHGYLVAPISLFFAYRAYRKIGPPASGELMLGLTGVVFGIVCQLAATVVCWPLLNFLGLLAVLRGLLVTAGGRKWASAFTFPLLFLFFMFPLPAIWTSYAALWLQDVVARLSETVISLFVVCHRVGHTIYIAGVDRSLVVAAECSGLGQIVAFLAFAALLGELFSRPVWYRISLLLAAVPLAIAANTLRVVLMNLGAYWFGTKWMNGALHDAPALFSIPVGILFFLLLDRVLAGFVGTRNGERGTGNAEPPSTEAATENTEPKTEEKTEERKTDKEAVPGSALRAPRSAPDVTRRLLIAAGVLTLGVAAEFALGAHLRQAGEQSYPVLLGRLESLHQGPNGRIVVRDPQNGQPIWIGKDMPEARDAILQKLYFKVEDVLVRVYQNGDGTQAQLYMVYTLIGEDRKHHPEICVRDAGGAPEDLRFRQEVPLAADGSASAMRFRFRTGAARSMVIYYWHYSPRPTLLDGQTAVQTIHQRIGVSAPSVTVQLTVYNDTPQALEAVERQLLPALHQEALQKVLPPGTETGCDRVPVRLARE